MFDLLSFLFVFRSSFWSLLVLLIVLVMWLSVVCRLVVLCVGLRICCMIVLVDSILMVFSVMSWLVVLLV